MFQFGELLIFSFFVFSSPPVGDIEQAFRQNSVSQLHDFFSLSTALNVSLPEPFSFSDQLSREQAYFLFKRIFASHKTFSFDAEDKLLTLPGRRDCIIIARWSFRNIKNNNPFVFLMFFHLVSEAPSAGGGGSPGGAAWRIFEIKAERL